MNAITPIEFSQDAVDAAIRAWFGITRVGIETPILQERMKAALQAACLLTPAIGTPALTRFNPAEGSPKTAEQMAGIIALRDMEAAVMQSAAVAAEPVASDATAFLCRIWGEDIDHTLTAILPDWDAVRRFCIEFWTGSEDATDYDGSSTLDNLKTELDEHEADERGGAYTQEWEIGGISIERICDCTPRAAAREPSEGSAA